jgi:hypothetical protein
MSSINYINPIVEPELLLYIEPQIFSFNSFIPQIPITNNIITYSCNDESIATVNPNTCEITMKKPEL